jgi:hypothetical protein
MLVYLQEKAASICQTPVYAILKTTYITLSPGVWGRVPSTVASFPKYTGHYDNIPLRSHPFFQHINPLVGDVSHEGVWGQNICTKIQSGEYKGIGSTVEAGA